MDYEILNLGGKIVVVQHFSSTRKTPMADSFLLFLKSLHYVLNNIKLPDINVLSLFFPLGQTRDTIYRYSLLLDFVTSLRFPCQDHFFKTNYITIRIVLY